MEVPTNIGNAPRHQRLMQRGAHIKNVTEAHFRATIADRVTYSVPVSSCERIGYLGLAAVTGLATGCLACCCCFGAMRIILEPGITGRDKLTINYINKKKTSDAHDADAAVLGFRVTDRKSILAFLEEKGDSIVWQEAYGHKFWPYFTKSGFSCFLFLPNGESAGASVILVWDAETGDSEQGAVALQTFAFQHCATYRLVKQKLGKGSLVISRETGTIRNLRTKGEVPIPDDLERDFKVTDRLLGGQPSLTYS